MLSHRATTIGWVVILVNSKYTATSVSYWYAAHSETKERYGFDRLYSKLIEQGHNISLYMIRSIKEQHGIKCRRHKRFKVTTDSNHNKLVYPNVLDQKFDVKRPNESWVSDITYIWTNEGWLY